MLSFLELYEALLTFVNFKLYAGLSLLYPPPLDEEIEVGATMNSTTMRDYR